MLISKAGIKRYLLWAGGLICLFSLLAWGGEKSWLLDLLSHFRWQYLIILLLISLLILALKNGKWALLFLPFLFINAIEVLPVVFHSPNLFTGTKFRLVAINLQNTNPHPSKAIEFIESSGADILVLSEFTPAWEKAVDPLRSNFPYQIHRVRKDNFGIAILSRFPFEQQEILHLTKEKIPAAYVELKIGMDKINLVGWHPLPPDSKRNFNARNQHYQEMEAFLKDKEEPLILAGDFNCSPYSVHFKKLKKSLALQDTRAGHGILATWPAQLYSLGIAIDHILISQSLRYSNRTVGPAIHSDHLPIIVDLAISEE